jgi:hypothetical protein
MKDREIETKANSAFNYKPVRGWKKDSEEALKHQASRNEDHNESMYLDTECHQSRA